MKSAHSVKRMRQSKGISEFGAQIAVGRPPFDYGLDSARQGWPA
jgi:hypothetical protein